VERGRLDFVRLGHQREGALQGPVQENLVEQLYTAGDLRHGLGQGHADSDRVQAF
jgi:hypothetical protein